MDIHYLSIYHLSIIYLSIWYLMNHYLSSRGFSFLFHGGSGIWSQGFVLANQEFYHLSHVTNPLWYGYFGDEGLTNFARAGLWPQYSWYQPPKGLGIQAWVTSIRQFNVILYNNHPSFSLCVCVCVCVLHMCEIWSLEVFACAGFKSQSSFSLPPD
jgi:hypothetical protein